MLSEFKPVSFRIAKRRNTVRHAGIGFPKLDHLAAVSLDQCLHFLDKIDFEIEARVWQRRLVTITRPQDVQGQLK